MPCCCICCWNVVLLARSSASPGLSSICCLASDSDFPLKTFANTPTPSSAACAVLILLPPDPEFLGNAIFPTPLTGAPVASPITSLRIPKPSLRIDSLETFCAFLKRLIPLTIVPNGLLAKSPSLKSPITSANPSSIPSSPNIVLLPPPPCKLNGLGTVS